MDKHPNVFLPFGTVYAQIFAPAGRSQSFFHLGFISQLSFCISEGYRSHRGLDKRKGQLFKNSVFHPAQPRYCNCKGAAICAQRSLRPTTHKFHNLDFCSASTPSRIIITIYEQHLGVLTSFTSSGGLDTKFEAF